MQCLSEEAAATLLRALRTSKLQRDSNATPSVVVDNETFVKGSVVLQAAVLEHCKIPLQLLVSLCKMSPTVLHSHNQSYLWNSPTSD
eukprot:5439592-Amphidinium_carterae.1